MGGSDSMQALGSETDFLRPSRASQHTEGGVLRRTTKFAAVLAASILALTACGSDDSNDSDSAGDSSSSAPTSDVKVGMAYDVGGRGDQSFNDSVAAGLDQAKSEG